MRLDYGTFMSGPRQDFRTKKMHFFSQLYRPKSNFVSIPDRFNLFQAVSDSMLVELKACFMEAYDDNQDGKIDIREVSIYKHNLISLVAAPGMVCE